MRLIWCKVQQKVVPADQVIRSKPQRSDLAAPYIQTGFQPYRSKLTNEIIDDRAQHKAHLRDHGAQEVGSDTPDWITERRYVRKHGGGDDDMPVHTPEPDAEGVSFEWQDLETDA